MKGLGGPLRTCHLHLDLKGEDAVKQAVMGEELGSRWEEWRPGGRKNWVR